MKNISNLSIVGYIAGIIFQIGNVSRYYISYPDIDKFLAYTVIAGLIIAFSWLYNNYLNQSNSILAIEDYLSDKFNKDGN